MHNLTQLIRHVNKIFFVAYTMYAYKVNMNLDLQDIKTN